MVKAQANSFHIGLEHSKHQRGLVMLVLQVYVDAFLIQQNFDQVNVTGVTCMVKPTAAPLVLEVYVYPKV